MEKTVAVRGERFEVLLPPERIAERLPSLAREIASLELADDTVVVVALKGGLIFAGDLLRHLPHTWTLDYVQARSYGSGTVASGRVELLRDLETDIAGRDVLLVDDIVDTGHTSAFLLEHLRARGARQVTLAVLLDKPERRTFDVGEYLAAFEVPDVFVVGYGLDYAERYRGLPFVGVPLEG